MCGGVCVALCTVQCALGHSLGGYAAVSQPVCVCVCGVCVVSVLLLRLYTPFNEISFKNLTIARCRENV